MLNEFEEFRAYTTFPPYTARNMYDSTYMGRFTFDMLLKFQGMARVLTILARGYMWETDQPDPDRARRALCAWCSIPDSKKAPPKKEGQSATCFREFHAEFPELVDESGNGWLVRHVHNIMEFGKTVKLLSSTADNMAKLDRGWDDAWRNKVMQFQVPLYSEFTKGAWALRFDDVIADALEAGPLRDNTIQLSTEQLQALAEATPKGVPKTVLPILAQYYLACRQEDTDWVVLPVTNFDAYFGTTAFGRRWLPAIPEAVMVRDISSYGISRYKIENGKETGILALSVY